MARMAGASSPACIQYMGTMHVICVQVSACELWLVCWPTNEGYSKIGKFFVLH